MRLFVKITAVLLLTVSGFIWLLFELAGWGVAYHIDSHRSWNKVKDLPVVSSMGHWNDTPYQKPFPLEPNPFSDGISKANWSKFVEASGFKISEEDGKCTVGIYAVDYLKEFDACAMRTVGPAACSYTYYVAANFESDEMSEVVGVRGAFICL